MPYVFYDELPEGAVEADVVSVSDHEKAVSEKAEEIALMSMEVDELKGKLGLAEERVESIQTELDQAKTKFANAFLTNPDKIKAYQADEMGREEQPATFETLFAGRTRNAN